MSKDVLITDQNVPVAGDSSTTTDSLVTRDSPVTTGSLVARDGPVTTGPLVADDVSVTGDSTDFPGADEVSVAGNSPVVEDNMELTNLFAQPRQLISFIGYRARSNSNKLDSNPNSNRHFTLRLLRLR